MRGKIDALWNAFWARGIANPIEVIEQITYLLFMRSLDDAQTLAENKANRTGRPMERRIFPEGTDGLGKGEGVAYVEMCWSRLKNRDAAAMYAVVRVSWSSRCSTSPCSQTSRRPGRIRSSMRGA